MNLPVHTYKIYQLRTRNIHNTQYSIIHINVQLFNVQLFIVNVHYSSYNTYQIFISFILTLEIFYNANLRKFLSMVLIILI